MKREHYNRKKLGKKIMALTLAAAMGLTGCGSKSKQADEDATPVVQVEPTPNNLQDGEISLPKSISTNPIVGNSTTGDFVYGGDPSVLVDGDTVYLYTGHDTSTDANAKNKVYIIREYLCYSTKDMVNWKSEGSVMTADTSHISWATGSTSAWASQVMKYKGKYYLYYCTWDRTASGKQSIGVAVSDSPTGQFVDSGRPLVQGTVTEPQSSNWDDIDPTAWIETDENGEEHRYLAWGNSKFYICELNEDMTSVKDLNGDGKITCGNSVKNSDIVNKQVGLGSYTEAPWLYRRQNEKGEYYGDYYLFYATGWREKMGYATTTELMSGMWKSHGVIMPPTATSNTNHMAVFDFKGKTYFVYHNGSLPSGNGYRRSACVTEVKWNEDGTIQSIPETAAGLAGTTSYIETSSGEKISHETYINSSADDQYPYKDVELGTGVGKDDLDAKWVLTAGKAEPSKNAYVSIQSENKPGLYWTANKDKTVTLAQDDDGSDDTAKSQTFYSVKALDGSDGVSLESVSQKGTYLTVVEGKLCLTDGSDKKASTFQVK